MAALESVLLRVSEMVCELPQIRDLDINPLIVDERRRCGGRAHRRGYPELVRERYGHMAIYPYPTHLATRQTLPDGASLVIRPIRPEDAEIERAFVRGLSEETRYFRFFGALHELSPEQLARFTQIDYDREMALVAVLENEDAETEIGVARYVINPDWQSCEFALVVADGWQHRGIGHRLMEALIDVARTKELKSMEGDVLAHNLNMLELVASLGFQHRRKRGRARGQTRGQDHLTNGRRPSDRRAASTFGALFRPGLGPEPLERIDHLFVGGLAEVVVKSADGAEIFIISRQTTSSASLRISLKVSVGATGTASKSLLGFRIRMARSAALVVAPVAIPSSTTIARRFFTSIGARFPRYSRRRRAISASSRSQARPNSASSIPNSRMTASLRTMTGAPPSTMAPMASSGYIGAPILRTRTRSSGAPSAAATSAATGTPPRGRARTTGSSPCRPRSARANFFPASDLSRNGMRSSMEQR